MSPSIRLLLAAAIVVQPLLLGLNAIFHPDVEMTADSFVSATAANANAWYAIHLIAALGALLTIAAALGVRSLIHERGRLVANIGVGVGIVAGVLLGVVFGAEASVMRLAVTSDLDPAGETAIVQGFLDAPEAAGIFIGVLAFVLGGVLLATALLLSAAVPRWQAGLYLAGTVATLAAQPGSLLGPISFGILGLAASFIAPHVARRDAELVATPTAAVRTNQHVASL